MRNRRRKCRWPGQDQNINRPLLNKELLFVVVLLSFSFLECSILQYASEAVHT